MLDFKQFVTVVWDATDSSFVYSILGSLLNIPNDWTEVDCEQAAVVLLAAGAVGCFAAHHVINASGYLTHELI